MLTVVCKATFLLKPNQTATLVAPEAPATADILWHRDSQSIGVPTDLVPFKRNVDVLLVGHAYAPQRRPVPSLLASLSVGTFTKSILVTGDRSWEPNGTCLEPEPFARVPLCWERAAGGPSTWNPIGVPVGARIDPQTRPRIPNLLPRGFVVQNSTHLIPPVGFGALAPHWPARAAYVQKWAASWNHAKWYEGLLPQELEAAYFNAAPTDQQLRELPETAQITLDHMHPDMPRLVSVIDDLRPRALITRTPGTAPQEVWLRADTLLIDADRVTCSISWRATIALRHPQEEGVVYVEPTRGVAAPSPAPVKTNAVLPFQQQTLAGSPPSSATNPLNATPPVPTSRPSTPDNRRWDMSMPVDESTTLPLRPEAVPSSSGSLPFRAPLPSSPPSALPPPAPPPRRESPSLSSIPVEERNAVVNRDKPSADAPLPFQSPAPSQSSFRADDDEVTGIFASPALKSAPVPATESPTPTPSPPAPPARSSVRVGKTLIPDTTPSTNQVLPFRPVSQAPEDPTSARNRLAAMSASSVLPFQTPSTPGDVAKPRERMPSVPPASAFAVPAPLAPPSAPPSVALPPPAAPLPIAPAPLSASGLPFQTPSANEPPPPPAAISASGLPFQTPSANEPPPPPPAAFGTSGLPFQTPSANEPPPPPAAISASGLPFQTPSVNEAPSPRAALSSSGLPFQTPPASNTPPPPRERLPSVPPMGSLFGTPLGSPVVPPASPVPSVAAPLGSSGLPFQTPSTNDTPPPPRERLPSVSNLGTPFSTPLQAAPPISSATTPPLAPPTDAPRPMQWSRLSGPNDDIKPTTPAAKSETSATQKPKSELSFERYARIKVHLWSPDASREDVLNKHGLDEIEWRILEQQQTEALELEAKEGKCDLALALVAAFEAANAPSIAAP